MPEQKPRTSLPFIVHQADLMAARIEFEKEWLPKFKSNGGNLKKNFKLETNKYNQLSPNIKQKALGSVKSENLMNLLNNI